MASHWFSGIRFQSLFPTGAFWFFVSGGVTGYRGNSVIRAFISATGARPKAAKINLMDCSCLCMCSEVDIGLN